MSTIGYESWAVDIAEVGAIYPFQGSEKILVLIGVVLWIVWHIIQMRRENHELAEGVKTFNAKTATHNIDDY